MVGQFIDGEHLCAAVVAELGQPEVFEVGNQNVFRPLVLFDGTTREIIQRLRKRGIQVTPQRFRLTEYDTRPEQVDVARIARRSPGGIAFKQIDALRDHTEATQQIRPELLGVGLFCVALVGGFPLINARPPMGHHGGEVFPDVATIQGGYSIRGSHTLNTTVTLSLSRSHSHTTPTHAIHPCAFLLPRQSRRGATALTRPEGTHLLHYYSMCFVGTKHECRYR